MEDFNVTMGKNYNFGELNDFSSLIDKPTCYKSFDKPTCIDLILTNKPSYFSLSFWDCLLRFSFVDSNIMDTGISKT